MNETARAEEKPPAPFVTYRGILMKRMEKPEYMFIISVFIFGMEPRL